MTKKTIANIIIIATVTLVGGCASTGQSRSTGEVVDDSSISTRVKSALLADPLTDGLDIELEVDRARVQLNGFADSEEERRRAEEVAAQIRGVVAVTNNLRIAERPRRVGEYIDDTVLVAKVNAALAKSPDVSALDIEVEVNRGIVTLGGFVDSDTEISAAQNAVTNLLGVREIVNNISVR